MTIRGEWQNRFSRHTFRENLVPNKETRSIVKLLEFVHNSLKGLDLGLVPMGVGLPICCELISGLWYQQDILPLQFEC